MHEIKNSVALEQAVKAAAQKTGRPVPKVMEEYWRSRLLARLFGAGTNEYVIKGGTGLLARIPDARRTRDLDIFARNADADSAIKAILAQAAVDLGDFCRFDLVSHTAIQQEASYRSGLRLKFQLHIGTRKVSSLVNIDLVFGCEPTAAIETIAPKNLAGFPLSDIEYPVYPLVDHIADKVCAIMERHGEGRESSRVRDLVDLCIIACNEAISLEPLATALASESRIRKIYPLAMFEIPTSWRANPERYQTLVKETKLPAAYRNQDTAIQLVSTMLTPALNYSKENMIWSPILLRWGW